MNRIKQLRKANKLTLDYVAKQLNLGISTLSQYESGKREASYKTLQSLANFFNVSIDYLLGKDENQPLKQHGVKIPVLGSIPAGIPLEAIENIIDYEEISEDMARGGDYFALKVQGSSMQPTINDGDVVIFRKQEDADTGKICVFMINGFDATLKEIKKEQNGIWVLPHNPNSEFKPTFYSNEDIERIPVRIIGVAVEIRRTLK